MSDQGEVLGVISAAVMDADETTVAAPSSRASIASGAVRPGGSGRRTAWSRGGPRRLCALDGASRFLPEAHGPSVFGLDLLIAPFRRRSSPMRKMSVSAVDSRGARRARRRAARDRHPLVARGPSSDRYLAASVSPAYEPVT